MTAVLERPREELRFLTDLQIYGQRQETAATGAEHRKHLSDDESTASGTGEVQLRTLAEEQVTCYFVYVQQSEVKMSVLGDKVRWAEDIIVGLQGIADLPENWNSYRSLRVHAYPVAMGLKVLSNILSDGARAPMVTPTADGGVGFEWHFPQVDIEIEITPEGRVIALVEDLETGEDEWEADITNNLSRLQPYIDKLQD